MEDTERRILSSICGVHLCIFLYFFIMYELKGVCLLSALYIYRKIGLLTFQSVIIFVILEAEF